NQLGTLFGKGGANGFFELVHVGLDSLARLVPKVRRFIEGNRSHFGRDMGPLGSNSRLRLSSRLQVLSGGRLGLLSGGGLLFLRLGRFSAGQDWQFLAGKALNRFLEF